MSAKTEEREWNGGMKKVLILTGRDPGYEFVLSIGRARLIYEHMDAIKEFVESFPPRPNYRR